MTSKEPFRADTYWLRGPYDSRREESEWKEHLRAILRDSETSIRCLKISLEEIASDPSWYAKEATLIRDFVEKNQQLHEVVLGDGRWRCCRNFSSSGVDLLSQLARAAESNPNVRCFKIEKSHIFLTPQHVANTCQFFNALNGSKAVLSALRLQQEKADHFKRKDIKALGEAIASVRKIEQLTLDEISGSMSYHILAAASQSRTLKKVCISDTDSRWDVVFVWKLARGLRIGKSVSKLEIVFRNMDADAAQHFANYLNEDSSLESLKIITCFGSDWRSFGPTIMNALSTKAGLSELELGRGALSYLGAPELVAQLLTRNQWLKQLSIYEYSSDIENGWMRSIANGLRHNSSLISLKLHVGMHCWLQTDMKPLKEVLTLPKPVDGTDDNGPGLKESYLDSLQVVPEVTVLVEILMHEHCRLQVLKVNVEYGSLRIIADALPKITKVTHLAVKTGEEDYFSEHAEIKEKIRADIKANPNLELAHFDECGFDPQFKSEIKSHCMLNRARKVSASLQEGELPLAILPNILHSFASQNEENPAEYHRYWVSVLSACKLTTPRDSTEMEPESSQQSLGRKRRRHSSS
jgi:hypothetical protein